MKALNRTLSNRLCSSKLDNQEKKYSLYYSYTLQYIPSLWLEIPILIEIYQPDMFDHEVQNLWVILQNILPDSH